MKKIINKIKYKDSIVTVEYTSIDNDTSICKQIKAVGYNEPLETWQKAYEGLSDCLPSLLPFINNELAAAATINGVSFGEDDNGAVISFMLDLGHGSPFCGNTPYRPYESETGDNLPQSVQMALMTLKQLTEDYLAGDAKTKQLKLVA